MDRVAGRRNAVFAPVVGVALAACVASCAPREAGDRPARSTQKDSSGVAIVTLSLESWPEPRPVEPTPAVTIPSEGPDEAWRLYRISALGVTDRGDVIVGNRGESQVLRFDRDGQLLAASGGAGEGPGEFSSLMHVAVAGEDALAVDFLPRRVTRFGPEGEFVEEFGLGSGAGRPLELHWTPSGLLGASFDLPSEYQSTDHLTPVTRIARFTLYDTAGRIVRTIAEAPGPEMHIVSQEVPGGMVSASVAPIVQHTTHHSILGDWLVIGHTRTWELVFHDLEGSVRRIVRAPGMERPTTEGAWRERVAARAEGLRDDLGDEAASALRVLDQLADAPRPGTLPAFGRLVGADDGWLWIGPEAAPAEGGIVWLLLNPATGEVDAVEVPAGFAVRAVRHGLVWGVSRDGLDVESIAAYRLPG